MTPPAGIGPRAAGIDPPALRQVLAAGRASANALGRAHLVEPPRATRTLEPTPTATVR